MENGPRLTAPGGGGGGARGGGGGGGGGGGFNKGSLVEVCRQGFQSNPDSGLGRNLIF